MKLICNIILTIAVLSFSKMGIAHEDHNHDAVSTLKAPKGGIMKSNEETNIEVVSKGQNLKIYLYDKDLKLQYVEAYKVTASAQKPRSKGKEAIALQGKGTYFEANYNAKGLHRYTLILEIKAPNDPHVDKINFIIEPKK